MFIVGIDVGGTFTDLTAADETTGKVVVTKVPSTPRNESAAVLSGLQALGIAGRDVRRLVHGTTVGTNAVLERRGARVAILTTAGFRDLIEIGRTKRNIPALFVPTFVRPKPVVERKHRFEVLERLAADGTVLAPLEPASVERALDAAVAAGAEALAVCLLHAYLNPAHERAVADAAKGRYPKLPVSCSADVVAEYREFERFSTTVLNAYLQPIMDSYLASQIKHDDVRTRVGPLRERLDVALELFGAMENAARHQLGLEGFTAQEQRLVRSLDLRYQGQAFELNVALGEPSANGLALDTIEAEFHRHHLAAYGHSSPGAQIELVNTRLTAYGVVPRPAGERYRRTSQSLDAALVERRAVWFAGAPHDCPVWERERLPERAALRGPAIVEEFGATTIVPPGWRGEVDEHGNLRFTRETPA